MKTSAFSWSRFCTKTADNGKKLPAFPNEVRLGFKLWSQRWEASVLPLHHHGPISIITGLNNCIDLNETSTVLAYIEIEGQFLASQPFAHHHTTLYHYLPEV